MTADARRQPMKVGFIGTGIMGFHMARRLAEAGHAVQAWNRSPRQGRASRTLRCRRSLPAPRMRPAMPTS